MSNDDNASLPPAGQLLLYTDGATKLQVRLEGNTVWLTQRLIAELYEVSVKTVNEHLVNIFSEAELPEDSVIRKFRITASDGKNYETMHYSLDAILAVGYRVRSARGTAFRQWATARLSELLVKGFTLDDERIKAGRTLGDDYFDELLARIRDIRSSERMFYQKITDIYATSVDYDKNAALTHEFFATVQNKLHWAIHGHTAAEIVRLRADAGKPHMGLTNWKNAPTGPVRKGDVAIAKNYLSREELDALNRIVTMYLDYADDQAKRKKTMTMADWIARLDAFLQFNERNILKHAGKVSKQLAEDHAHAEFARYDADRLHRLAAEPSSDFDKLLDESNRLGKSLPPPKKPRRKKPGGHDEGK